MTLKEIYLLDRVQKGKEITETQALMLRRKGFISETSPPTVALDVDPGYPNDMVSGIQSEIDGLTRSESKIRELILNERGITVAEMVERTGFSERKIYGIISKLTEMRIIERIGSKKNGSWSFVDPEE